MAGLTRKTSIQFGSAGTTTNFGVFGSKELGVTATSKDPAAVQSLSAWIDGWTAAIVAGDSAAYVQDMNGFCLVDSYQITYLFQMGIPEYDASTLYFTGSIVQRASDGQQFRSLRGGVAGVGAGQSGNTPPSSSSNSFWQWINPPQNLVGTSATLNTLQKVTNTSPTDGVPDSVELGDSLLSESGGNVVLASGGIQFPDATVQTTAAVSSNAVTVASPPSAYRTVPIQPSGTSGARALGTIYQNSSSKPLFVIVSVSSTTATNISAYCDGTTNPTTVIGQAGLVSGPPSGVFVTGYFQLFLIVLPSYWYKILGGTLQNWTEWS